MSRYQGKQHKGAARAVKAQKKREAVERNARTEPTRTRNYRRVIALAERVLS